MLGVKTRIGPIMAIFMIGVALIYDGAKFFINLITFGFLGWLINPLINFWATMTFLFWFTYLGVSFFKKSKLQGAKIASMSVPSVIGLIPLIDSLPFWTSGVTTNIATVYAEDLVESLSPETLKSIATVVDKYKKSKNRNLNQEKTQETDKAKEGKEKKKEKAKETSSPEETKKEETQPETKERKDVPQKETREKRLPGEAEEEEKTGFLEFKEKTGTLGRPERPEDDLPIEV